MNNIYDNEEFFKEYSKMARSQMGLEGAGEWQTLRPMLPDLKGKAVLDLGCGYGWHCKYAAEQGASFVLGIDQSEKMLETAKQKNSHPKITYLRSEILSYDYRENEFDFVISNLALHYIADLNEVYRRVFKTLKPNGVFVFNIEHPTFTGSVNQDWIYSEDGKPLFWPVDNYFYLGERETVFLGKSVRKQHHTLTQILNGLIDCGFLIEGVKEAVPPENMMNIEGMKDEMRRPMMLLVRAKKQ